MAPGALIDYDARDGAALEATSDDIDNVNYLKGLPSPPLSESKDNTKPTDSSEKDKSEYRQYENACSRVQNFYAEQHAKQTVAYNLLVRNQLRAREKQEMTVWEAMEKLNTLIDESDPDTDLGQIQHLLQAAEAMRRDGRERWMQVTGLVHDLGKLLYFYGSEGQWDVVGDTFPVGCAFDESIIYHDTFKHNPDVDHPLYSTKHGIYPPNCGLDNVMLSWGHDEYLYHVLKDQSTLPKEALAMIRYHSFYPWHKEGAYEHLMNGEEDERMLRAVREFNPYDLYSKSDGVLDVEALKPYYMELIDEFFPQKVLKW